MDVYRVNTPYKPLTIFWLCDCAKKLNMNLHGIFMRDNLPLSPLENESAIVNSTSQVKMGVSGMLLWKRKFEDIFR